jgi:hypothetical protein
MRKTCSAPFSRTAGLAAWPAAEGNAAPAAPYESGFWKSSWAESGMNGFGATMPSFCSRDANAGSRASLFIAVSG